jgi:hypothetical protein
MIFGTIAAAICYLIFYAITTQMAKRQDISLDQAHARLTRIALNFAWFFIIIPMGYWLIGTFILASWGTSIQIEKFFDTCWPVAWVSMAIGAYRILVAMYSKEVLPEDPNAFAGATAALNAVTELTKDKPKSKKYRAS